MKKKEIEVLDDFIKYSGACYSRASYYEKAKNGKWTLDKYIRFLDVEDLHFLFDRLARNVDTGDQLDVSALRAHMIERSKKAFEIMYPQSGFGVWGESVRQTVSELHSVFADNSDTGIIPDKLASKLATAYSGTSFDIDISFEPIMRLTPYYMDQHITELGGILSAMAYAAKNLGAHKQSFIADYKKHPERYSTIDIEVYEKMLPICAESLDFIRNWIVKNKAALLDILAKAY